MKKIAFLDDHKLFTETLGDFVKSRFEEVIVSRYHDPLVFLDEFKNQDFDLLVLDLEMPNKSGIEVISEIRKIKPAQSILVLSMFYNVQIAFELRKLGVQSFLPKNCDVQELEDAIEAAIKNEFYYLDTVDEKSIDNNKNKKTLLTRRELEIINLSTKGFTSAQIGNEVFISEGTVKTHVKNILLKTQLSNFKEVISYYQKEGWEVLT